MKISIFVLGLKQDIEKRNFTKEVKLRFRLTDGVNVQLVHKTGLSFTVGDLSKFNIDGGLKKRVDVYNHDLKDVIDKHIGAMEQVYSNNPNVAPKDFNTEVDKIIHPELYVTKEEQEKQKTIWEKAKEYLEAQKVCDGRKRAFKVAVRCMFRYERYLNEIKHETFSWNNIEDITLDDIQDFRDYLESESDQRDTPKEQRFFEEIIKRYPDGFRGGFRVGERGQHSVDLKLKQIKSFFKNVCNERKMANPFDGFKIKSYEYAEPYLLTKEERDRLASCPMPSECLTVVRDIFIFQCYCGARVSDLTKLTKANLNGNELSYIPHKTAKDSTRTPHVPLTDYPMSLIKKYDGVDKQGRLFPFISDQKYNKYIKECFTVAGLTRNVNTKDTRTGVPTMRPLNEIASSHLARRTFVGLMYAGNISLEVIGTMSGHTEDSREISRYYNVTQKQRQTAAKALESDKSNTDSIVEQLAKVLTPEQLAKVKTALAV